MWTANCTLDPQDTLVAHRWGDGDVSLCIQWPAEGQHCSVVLSHSDVKRLVVFLDTGLVA